MALRRKRREQRGGWAWTAFGVPALCFALSLPASADKVHPKAGTTAAAFLKLGVGPRALAMGGAYVAVSDDAYAGYWNPAGLTQLSSRELALMHDRYFEDLSQNFLAYAQPLSPVSAMSVHALGLFLPKDLERRTGTGEEVPTAAPTSAEGKFGANDLSVASAYSRVLGGGWSGGVSLKFIRQSIDDERAFGCAADVGVLRRRAASPFSFGASLQNMGPALKFRRKHFILPAAARAGMSWRSGEKWLLALDLHQPVDNYPSMVAGTEYRPLKMAALRAGYRYRLYGNELEAFSGINLGLGLVWKSVGLDYVFSHFGELENAHRLGMTFRFGSAPAASAAETPSLQKTARASEKAVETEVPLSLSLHETVKLLQIRGQKTVHEILAVADPESDVLRLFFQTESSLAQPVDLSLEERHKVPAPSQAAGLMVYKEYRLVGLNLRVKGRLGTAFRIPKAWLDEKGLAPEHVALYAWNEGGWKKQPTRLLGEEGSHYEFRSDASSMDRWVLGGEAE